jgi:hypothetical protein
MSKYIYECYFWEPDFWTWETILLYKSINITYLIPNCWFENVFHTYFGIGPKVSYGIKEFIEYTFLFFV